VITVLAGGVGAARFLRGLVHVVESSRVVAVVNTADDTEMHGLSISPDVDTVLYTLSGRADSARGWGLEGETWRAMEAHARFESVRPEDSTAGGTWFNLGDTDLATHLYRTARLDEGARARDVVDELRRASGVSVRVVPMTDDRVRTMVRLAGEASEVSFQEYFVRLRHSVPVAAVRFAGAESARFVDTALLADAETVVIAPSNPIVSIGPVRALPGVDELLSARRDTVVAVSPIVAGAALKGPADRMLAELGHEPSVVGVARLYAPVCATLVVDARDAGRADEVEREGMRCVVTDTVMSSPAIAASLAAVTVAAGGGPVGQGVR
jgi:LPPG:FO 2-phospho-L-lactate transferase